MSTEQGDKLDPAISNKLANAMKGRNTTGYSPEVRKLAQDLLFANEVGDLAFWEDAPEERRAFYLKEAAQRLG